MASYSNKFKCVLHLNDKEEGVIVYDDMTYSLLLEMVMKRFNLDPNVWLNLSFNLPSIEMDIQTTGMSNFLLIVLLIPLMEYHICTLVHLKIIPGPTGILQKALLQKNADVMEGGHDNIMPTQEYVRKVNEDVSEDDHFMHGPWLSVVVYLHGKGVMASGCLGQMKKYCKNEKLEMVVGVVMSCTPNALGDLVVTLNDPTGIMGGTIHYKVFKKEDSYAKSINIGSVLILRNVSVFTPKPSNHYLNITIKNIVKVFDKDT
ncbi:hypothetical protein Tco_0797053 [Tanacetum coccineum]